MRLIIFIGWVLSACSFVIALASLTTPGASKLMSLAMIGWCLIFLPPFWKNTIKYGLPTNIISRVVAFITLPIFFMKMATANGYKPEVSTVKTQPEASSISVSPTPVKTEPPNPLSERVTPKPAKSSIAVSPSAIRAESPPASIKTPSPAVITQCSEYFESIKYVKSKDKLAPLVPALSKCDSVAEFAEGATPYLESIKISDARKFTISRCVDRNWIDTKICQLVAKDPKIKTTYYLDYGTGDTGKIPVGDHQNMQRFLEFFKDGREQEATRLAIDAGFDLMSDQADEVDVVSNDGELTEVRLNPTDESQAHLKGKTRWVISRFVQRTYSEKL
jgi:hypothetical protein